MGTKWSALSSATPTTATTLCGVVSGVSKKFTAGVLGLAAGLTDVIDAKRDYGAVGDNSTDDTTALQNAIDACVGTVASPHANALSYTNKVLYIPPGRYKITAALNMKHVVGFRMIGAGRFVTKIIQNTANLACILTNGCSYSHFEGMHLSGSGTAAIFDLDWDNSANGLGLQSNTFQDMFFEAGAYGVRLGATGYMGSENLFLNCFWATHTTAGISTQNFNALQNTIIGGNFQGCAIGVEVSGNGGSFGLIAGTGFQVQTTCDINLRATAGDTLVVQGCRTESVNFFLNGSSGQITTLIGCTHISGSNGYFVDSSQNVSMEGCYSLKGTVHPQGGVQVVISNCWFERSDWMAAVGAEIGGAYAAIEIHNVYYDTGGVSRILYKRITSPSGTLINEKATMETY